MKENLLHPPNTFWIIVSPEWDGPQFYTSESDAIKDIDDYGQTSPDSVTLYKVMYDYKNGFSSKYVKSWGDFEQG